MTYLQLSVLRGKTINLPSTSEDDSNETTSEYRPQVVTAGRIPVLRNEVLELDCSADHYSQAKGAGVAVEQVLLF